MANFYKTLRTGIYVFLLVLAVAALVFENLRGAKTAFPGLSLYEAVRSAVLYDPYDSEVLAKVRISGTDFRKNIYLIANSVSDLITNGNFYNNVFIFMVSKKADGIAGLINQTFTNITSFSDLIILDRDRNIVYKHGSASFSIGDFTDTNDRAILTLDKEIAVLGNYRDATLDNEIRIIALFNTETIAAGLKEFPYPAFLVISNRMYRNSGILPDIIRNIQQNPRDEREYYTGLSVVQTFPINAGGVHIGTLGIVYPARNILSILLIFFKIILLLLLAFGIFALDRSLKRQALKAELQKKQNRTATPMRKMKKKEITPEEEEAAIDMRLDWFHDYVKDQDHPEENDRKGEPK